MSVSVTYGLVATAVETLPNNTGSAPDASRQVTHTNYNVSGTLDGTTTPAVTMLAEFLLTLSSGAATINLRTLTGTNGATVDGNGLKVQIFRVKNLGANPMTFTFGASNPYNIFGATGVVTIPAGATIELFANGGAPAIDDTHKTIDVTGTGAQTAQITVIMG